MVQLLSPGTSINVINNQVAPASTPGTTPTIFLATQSNKLLSDGVTVAPGTLPANAGKVYNLTSQRECLQTFGNPFFETVDGTVQQGSEINEYGLHAAWSYLGLANSVNVIRADLDLSQLSPQEAEPTAPPANGTYWFDYETSSFGAFRANGNPNAGLAWNQLAVLTPTLEQVDGSFVPLSTFGAAGQIAVVPFNPNGEIALYEKISTQWLLIGSPAWEAARQTVLTGTVQIPGTIAAAGELVINGTTVNISGASTVHTVNDTATHQALVDAQAAYDTLSVLSATTLTGDLGGKTLTPGIYSYTSSAGLTGTLTLDFQGLSNQQIVVITGSTLTTAAASLVNVINNTGTGNQVFFVVGSSATLGATSTVAGNILADISISMGNGVTVTGNAIALTGAVTMINDFVTAVPSAALLTAANFAVLAHTAVTNTGASEFAGDIGAATATAITGVTSGSGATLATIISNINTAAIPHIIASSGGLASEQLVLTNTAGLGIVIGATSTPALLTALGMPALTTPGYELVFAPNTSVPSGLHPGDIWIKTTNPNFGASFVVKKYNSSVEQWQTVAAPLYLDDVAAEVGQGLALNRLYVEFNTLGTLAQPEAAFVIKQMASIAPVSSNSGTFVHTDAGTFGIRSRASAGATVGADTTVNVTFTGSETLADAVLAINTAIAAAGTIPHVVASAVAGALVITSNNGSAVDMIDALHATWSGTTVPNGIFSNWIELPYVASINAPTQTAAEGSLWFNPELVVDIMVDNGNEWVGYLTMYPATDPNGPQVTSEEPTTQSTGNPLQENDLWIQSDDVVGYPEIYRWQNGAWVLIDNTDHTTPLGIVFGDVRQDSGPTGAWLNGAQPVSTLPADLLLSSFVDPVDLQVLNPQIFPAGILLFNTEIGTDNVKVRRNSYFSGMPETYTVGAATFNVDSYLSGAPGRWISESGNDLNGVGLMGRFAQREMVVKALAAQIVGNEAVLDENLYMNILSCPGYVEVLSDLVTLNVDRQETAFIISDVPATLTPDATSINAWAQNKANVAADGRLGRITEYDYSAMYYPWGLGTNVDGSQVAIPSSTMALNVYGYNDRVGYPWTSPAGTRRGIVTNASSAGYIDPATMEYKPWNVNQGQRDALYQNNMNPILFMPGQGLLVRGDKTMTPDATGLLTRVNVARTVVYVRYILPKLLEDFLFENVTPALLAAAKNKADKFMTGMVGQGGLTDFANKCDLNNNTPETIAANEIHMDSAVVPVFASNFIYIKLSLQISLQQ
jgi:hypothetical protein